MSTHCYLYRLKAGVNPADAADRLLSMKEHIPSLASLEVGINFSKAENAFDLVQISRFETEEDFDAFSRHPYHQSLRTYFGQAAAETAKADYYG